jgi:hypothetical protein
VAGHVQPAADQLGREVDQQFVDAAFAQQRAIELVARLDVQLVDAARRQVFNIAPRSTLPSAFARQVTVAPRASSAAALASSRTAA